MSAHERFYALIGGKGLTIKESLNFKWRVWLLLAIHYETDFNQGKLTSDLLYSAHIKLCLLAPLGCPTMPKPNLKFLWSQRVHTVRASAITPFEWASEGQGHDPTWEPTHRLPLGNQVLSCLRLLVQPFSDIGYHIQVTQKNSQKCHCLVFCFRVQKRGQNTRICTHLFVLIQYKKICTNLHQCI